MIDKSTIIHVCPHCRLRVYAGRCGCGQWNLVGGEYVRSTPLSREMTELAGVSTSTDPRQFLRDVLEYVINLGNDLVDKNNKTVV
jgi:hypothetical protein